MFTKPDPNNVTTKHFLFMYDGSCERVTNSIYTFRSANESFEITWDHSKFPKNFDMRLHLLSILGDKGSEYYEEVL